MEKAIGVHAAIIAARIASASADARTWKPARRDY